MSKVTKLPTQAPKRGTYRYADLVLNAYEQMFGELDRQHERESRREERWKRSEIERRNHQKL